jgi:beta-aspartyl-peptidase (threonine type)
MPDARGTIILVMLLAACARAADSEAEIRSLLIEQIQHSADAWNRGDLDAFVGDYAHDSTTTFMAAGHARRGFDFIRGNYAPRFAPGAQRDSLSFEELDARPLSPALALLTGRFILHRGGSVTASGPFTLVLERRSDGWKILHDHSSSDPAPAP